MADDEILIRGDTATMTRPDGKSITMSVAQLFENAAPKQIDSCGIGLPPEVRFAYTRENVLILVCEYPPGPYTLSWIADNSPAPFGKGAKYQSVTISLPYVIVLAAFEGAWLSDFNECFFRTAPLDTVDEENELLFPGLLNCSRFMPPEGKPLAWICTQHLDRRLLCAEHDSRKQIAVGLASLRSCLFEQSFNLSSDHHEYSSWYTESRVVDERISTISRWHEETANDRFMGLDIPWLKTNETLKTVVDRIYRNKGIAATGVRSAQQLARIMVNSES